MNWFPSRRNPAAATRKLSDWFFCLILAVVTLLAYQPAWNGSLLWDDHANMTTPDLRSFDGLRRVWFEPRTTQQYYPLLYTSYWVQQRVLGDSATGYHLLNILFHVGCAVLVLKILRFLRIPGAELASIIFALHPVNVESVAWITERKNTLSGLFGLAATFWYLKFDEFRTRQENDGQQSHGYGSYTLALSLFLLALLSKTAVVTIPLAWLVILWWKRGAISWPRNLISLAPFLLLSAAAGLMTRWVEYGNIAYRARSLDFSLLDRCLIAGRAFWFQLSKVLWPSNLMFIYPRWEVNAAVWWQYLFPLGTLALLAVLWGLRRWYQGPFAGMFIYILLLLPTLGFLNQSFFVFSFVSDHWQYLACLGIITPCASGIVQAGKRLNWENWLEPATTLLLGGVLFVLTSHESRAYTDIETLYRTAIARNPDCWMAEVNLGNLLYQTNRSEAMDLFKQAERTNPAIAHYSLGNSLFNAGRTSEAMEQYKEALRIDPDYAEAHSNLGNVYFRAGQTSEAIEQYKEALRIDPGFAAAHNNLAIALFQTSRVSEAIDHYKQSLRISPNSAFTHSNLGAALAQAGRIPEAIKELEAALRINPYDGDARSNLMHLEAMQKDAGKALK